jgi:hypothetical protein
MERNRICKTTAVGSRGGSLWQQKRNKSGIASQPRTLTCLTPYCRCGTHLAQTRSFAPHNTPSAATLKPIRSCTALPLAWKHASYWIICSAQTAREEGAVASSGGTIVVVVRGALPKVTSLLRPYVGWRGSRSRFSRCSCIVARCSLVVVLGTGILGRGTLSGQTAARRKFGRSARFANCNPSPVLRHGIPI